MLLLTIILLGYIIGSIPTAVWVGKSFRGIDIREHGSKNAGATNTFRVLGKRFGWIVLIVDVSKGVLAACLPHFFTYMLEGYKDEFLILQLCGSFSAVFGHVFPIFAHFRGGKGVATSLGIVIGINPYAALVCLAIFLVVFLSSRYVSLGAIISALCFPFVSYFMIQEDARIMIIFTVVLGVMVILAHRKNIDRLWKGEENKMNLFAKKA
ncbi:MAG: glycerol-3-phosphate 1-O-acyltransferase PlsY [Crocinitomicaceae bacterium]|nr:glycerol-3-phosphate 1-O-acyltransferase PlsY [Crocinitomicaceae bacterium]MBP6031880.1 glycerol-3-phosphate 1-O-acyltransferase PlsY [Crocinitomicaceae bacterium]